MSLQQQIIDMQENADGQRGFRYGVLDYRLKRIDWESVKNANRRIIKKEIENKKRKFDNAVKKTTDKGIAAFKREYAESLVAAAFEREYAESLVDNLFDYREFLEALLQKVKASFDDRLKMICKPICDESKIPAILFPRFDEKFINDLLKDTKSNIATITDTYIEEKLIGLIRDLSRKNGIKINIQPKLSEVSVLRNQIDEEISTISIAIEDELMIFVDKLRENYLNKLNTSIREKKREIAIIRELSSEAGAKRCHEIAALLENNCPLIFAHMKDVLAFRESIKKCIVTT
jgi:hypothetical protein